MFRILPLATWNSTTGNENYQNTQFSGLKVSIEFYINILRSTVVQAQLICPYYLKFGSKCNRFY